MPKSADVIRLKLPKTAAQADRLKRLARRRNWVEVKITVLADRDAFRLQRTWRILFGLYQDCATIPLSKGFRKVPGKAFIGKMEAVMLPVFLHEAMPLVGSGRADIHVEGDRLRPRLLEVMAA